jgi:hypothetical protein
VEPRGGAEGFQDRGLGGDTVATRLKRAGYGTALLGKYFSGYKGRYIPPGWDTWLAVAGSNQGDTYEVNSDGEVRPVSRDEWHSTDLIADRAGECVRARAGQPWFAYFATSPLRPP